MTSIKSPTVFIGTGRSGSTYISGSILSHRDLGYPSNYLEKFPGYPTVNRIRTLFDNRFWRFTTRGGYSKALAKSFFLPSESYSMWRYLVGSEVDFSRSFLLTERLSPELKQKVLSYFETMVALQGRQRLAFKITGPSRLGFLLSIFPDAQFVWVKRDLIPTLKSFVKQDFWRTRGYDKLWFTGAYTDDEITFSRKISHSPELITAFQLNRINQITERELAFHKPCVKVLNYEDFLVSPQNHIDDILTFLNLEKDPACYKYVKRNPVRVGTTDPTKLYSSEIIDQINKISFQGLPTEIADIFNQPKAFQS